MPKFEFLYFDNNTNRILLESIVYGLPDIWPAYARTVLIAQASTDPECPNNTARCLPHPEYRRVRIDVLPNFYLLNPDKQRKVIVEEIIHAIYGELDNWIQEDVLASLREHNAALAAVFLRQYMRLWENVTNELVAVLMRSLSTVEETPL